MAEAGPSYASGTPSTSVRPSVSQPRHSYSRPQFPSNGHDVSNSRMTRRPDAATRMSSLGLGHPPRRYTAGGDNEPIARGAANSSRRRVKSVDLAEPTETSSRFRSLYDLETNTHKRFASMSRRGRREEVSAMSESPDMFSDISSAAAFSDEYDLSHEDPGILEDVQRALRLKARREARLKGMKVPAVANEVVFADQVSASSHSPQSSPRRPRLPELAPSIPPPLLPPAPSISAGSMESEIDFSPSVGNTSLHPVPSSCDGGVTLDWTGSGSEDEKEKRWHLSVSRRKHKRSSAYSDKTSVEKQDILYMEKIATIRNKAKPHTLRKAAITGNQLGRRYAAILGSSTSHDHSLNLLDVARWFGKQEPVVQASLDSAEPLTWLKHLIDKRDHRSRLPWHVTALTFEEYSRTTKRSPPMQTIPEEGTLHSLTSRFNNHSPPLISVVSPESKSASSGSWSWSSPPRNSLEPSLSRRKVSQPDDTISFEPQVDSGRESLVDSRRNSVEPLPPPRISAAYGTDSARSSIHSGVFHGISPGSGRIHIRDIARRIRRKPYDGSEPGSSRNSISEHSPEDMSQSSLKGRKRPRPTSLQARTPPPDIGSDEERAPSRAQSNIGRSGGESGLPTARQNSSSLMHSAEMTARADALSSAELSPIARENWPQPEPPARPPPLRKRRMSLPSLHQLLLQEQQKRQQGADEERERELYEHRTQLLEDTLSQNHSTRQFLYRVGANIREYDNVQARLSALTGTPHKPIPQEVLDTFSHDPASITTGTRRYKSWRAIEDIHERIGRQRDTLQEFVLSISPKGEGPNFRGVMDEPMAALSRSLGLLEQHRQRIAREADYVGEKLNKVKELHKDVKREYNEVLGHTSLIYPELSQIVALEESYRNQYQQFWDIGLDALTLLLDTATPVWRNYGKVIGEDVQDFLIIPWYRNEFTGEPKRYPIKHLPKRSFRHWIGLFVFSIISVCVTGLQIGAALSSTLNYNLPWITHTGFRWMFIPFFIVGLIIQWCAVLVECSVVLAQAGVVVWWLGWTVRIFS